MEPAGTLGTGFFQYTPRILYHEEQRVHPVHMKHLVQLEDLEHHGTLWYIWNT